MGRVVLLIPDVGIILRQEFLDLIVDFELFPDVLAGYFIEGLELLYLLGGAADGGLGLPA